MEERKPRKVDISGAACGAGPPVLEEEQRARVVTDGGVYVLENTSAEQAMLARERGVGGAMLGRDKTGLVYIDPKEVKKVK